MTRQEQEILTSSNVSQILPTGLRQAPSTRGPGVRETGLTFRVGGWGDTNLRHCHTARRKQGADGQGRWVPWLVLPFVSESRRVWGPEGAPHLGVLSVNSQSEETGHLCLRTQGVPWSLLGSATWSSRVHRHSGLGVEAPFCPVRRSHEFGRGTQMPHPPVFPQVLR